MNQIIIEIPNYIRQVKLSEKRSKKFYVKGKKEIPKKYSDNKRFVFKKKGTKFCLYDSVENEFIIANPRTQGTPKIKTINGQAIYNGFVSKWERATMMNKIGDSFSEAIKDLSLFPYNPVKITIEVHDLIKDPICKEQEWDLRNREFPYGKKFEDLIKKKIIKDDSVLYYTCFKVQFVPIDNEVNRKLVFIIEKETDERVLKHHKYV